MVPKTRRPWRNNNVGHWSGSKVGFSTNTISLHSSGRWSIYTSVCMSRNRSPYEKSRLITYVRSTMSQIMSTHRSQNSTGIASLECGKMTSLLPRVDVFPMVETHYLYEHD